MKEKNLLTASKAPLWTETRTRTRTRTSLRDISPQVRLFTEEVDKITSLVIGLSSRLARASVPPTLADDKLQVGGGRGAKEGFGRSGNRGRLRIGGRCLSIKMHLNVSTLQFFTRYTMQHSRVCPDIPVTE